ncbi:unnamed protein product [Rangifer tarandus platyrhynchus]|uniref:Carboxylic ester hydrolase n=1 Tax=Rangifer tarandus platyrhynchus TaxID=3082113 RepID=A0ABN8YKX7_RANTA|nr:unnamed protein product [Rangifer tarandus platyrhynchus]
MTGNLFLLRQVPGSLVSVLLSSRCHLSPDPGFPGEGPHSLLLQEGHLQALQVQEPPARMGKASSEQGGPEVSGAQRCSQDRVGAQLLSDLFTNRKENISLTFSEDCLYLNIYTPADLTKRSRLPVIVWIHEGGLLMGGASTFDGLVLSAHENVVVVTIQYRLGIWGFFSTGDEHSRGNWGHLDQVAALRWVQENIANFGGDPGSVTIFGESAGGESVSVLNYPFLPTVVDGVLLPRIPEEMLAEKNFNTVPYIVGINKKEFGWILPLFMRYPLSEDKLDQETATSLVWQSYPILSIPEELAPVATDKYLGGTDDPVKKKGLFLDLIGDGMFGVPSVNVARRHRDAGAPTYMYEFRYRPSFSSELKPETVIGDHGDELFSVFGAPFLKDQVNVFVLRWNNAILLSERRMKTVGHHWQEGALAVLARPLGV